MSSSSRDTIEARPKKKLSGTHSNFKVERSRSQKILQKNTGNEALIIINAARSSSEMQKTPFYCDIIITRSDKHKSS